MGGRRSSTSCGSGNGMEDQEVANLRRKGRGHGQHTQHHDVVPQVLADERGPRNSPKCDE